MTLRDDFLPVFDWGRELIESFGLRPNTLTIRTTVWGGGEVMLGQSLSAVVTDLVIDPTPKFRELDSGRLVVGPITPVYSGGGYSVGQLNPESPKGITATEVRYIVTGPNSGTYFLKELDTTKSFAYFLTLEDSKRDRP